MSSGFIFWSSVVTVGAILGALFRPRHIAILFGCLAGMCILGLVLSGIAGSNAVWYFGIALMAGLPAAAVSFLVATIVHAATRRSTPKHSDDQAKD